MAASRISPVRFSRRRIKRPWFGRKENARITDQPIAALITDMKQRGLLDETLIVWAGEMGRTPHSAGTDGRDHHVGGYTIWMAGGGIRGGITYGATDEMGMSAIENRLDIHDIHATILHRLGLDHTVQRHWNVATSR
jgi:uncharacterized protein (DUF1501 family)